MSDKISALPVAADVVSGDLFVVVDNPSGTAVTKKLDFDTLVTAVTDAIMAGGTGRTMSIEVLGAGETNETLEFVNGMLKQ